MWWRLLFAVLGALTVQHVFKIILLLDIFKHVQRHQPGPCELVPDMDYGSEDMEALPDGKVFITSGIGMIGEPDKLVGEENRGRIMLLDLSSKDRTPKSLPISGAFDRTDFHPHGISLYKDKKGSVYLYVVNHPIGGDRIEKFFYNPKTGTLEHMRSLQDDHATKMANDVVAVGENQFYYTNFHYYNSVPGMMVEGLFLLSWGSIVFYDGQSHRVVMDGLMSPNGINTSPDGKYVYVAFPVLKEINVYTRNSDNSLTLYNVIQTHTMADNIDVDPTSGDLYLGCHPVGWRISQHLQDPHNITAPSQVLRVKMKDGHATDIQELYSEDGDVISGSSVAVYTRKQLLIGTVTHKMVRCDVKYMEP